MVTRRASGVDETDAAPRFPLELVLGAAQLYYAQDINQAEVATRLHTSRATVSRLLAEARRLGIVRIEVVPPDGLDDQLLAEQVAARLGLDRVWVGGPVGRVAAGTALAPRLSAALQSVGLTAGDVLLVASGRTLHDAARTSLPALPGVLVAAGVGGQEEPEPWYQTNEIARAVAAGIGGRPVFLYAPALPSPPLHRSLLLEPSIQRLTELWTTARCAVLGIGSAPLTRESIPECIPVDPVSLRDAVGDICLRFFDVEGHPVPFDGSERMMSVGLELLHDIPVTIGVAAGPDKVPGIRAAARAGYITDLVTDRPTAAALLAVPDDRTVPAGEPGVGTATS